MKRMKLKPYTKVILTMLGAILIGGILLALPISQVEGANLGLLDSLFMSTSAVCVTGLTVVRDLTMTFNSFGLFIMVILMEIGGLGLVTITMFFAIIFGAKIGIADRFNLKEILNQNSNRGMVKLVLYIVAISLSVQLIFGIVNIIILSATYPMIDAIRIGLFHSVSSFNNAGFDIFGGNSMIAFADNIALNVSTILTIILGGLGFIVIIDLVSKLRHGKSHRVSMHSKIVIIMTFAITAVGTLLLKICMGAGMTWLEALFQCVTARTAGFESVDMNLLNTSASTIMIGLMFIGASPCSTGGGIKTTTIFVIMLALLNLAQGKSVVVFNRKIENQSIIKACALFAIAVMYIFLAVFILCALEPHLTLLECLFEVVSAFATVGLSMSITPSLAMGSKIVIMITMFVGRIGPLTIINIFNNNWARSSESVEHIEEKMIIG